MNNSEQKEEKNIPNLDQIVKETLLFLSRENLPKIDTKIYKRPLVVGSGNALYVGKIIYREEDAIFSNESEYEDVLKNIDAIDGVVIISSSGSKHSPLIIKKAKENNKKVTLITNSSISKSAELINENGGDVIYVFPKIKEPYTYNTSTYFSMILSVTKENPQDILSFIENNIENIDFSIFKNYQKYFCILPASFSLCTKMVETKFIELFGRNIGRDVFTYDSALHATTLVRSKELFIHFGDERKLINEENSLNINLPENISYVSMLAISYYVVGKIQSYYGSYFKENLDDYVKKTSEIFGDDLNKSL